jgi:hypothetical protein
VAEIEWLVLSGLLMCSPKGFGSRPCFECGAALPHRVGCVQGVVFRFRPFEQLELHEPGHVVEIAFTGQSDALEITLASFDDAVHGDKHWRTFYEKQAARVVEFAGLANQVNSERLAWLREFVREERRTIIHH